MTKAAKTKLNEAIKVKALTGRRVDVVLIDEGLGNKVNRNYYGPEAMETAPAAFEGASCFTDHPSESEAADRPERSVWHKAGYFSNVRCETIAGKKSVRATLTLDETETGETVFSKVKAAINFKAENPTAQNEYVGLSINAQGETEKKTLTVEGEEMEVNYVTAFVKDPFTSVDMVTAPARGGRFLALLESISGRRKNNKEATQMSKALKALLAKLNEAAEVKSPEELKEKMKGIMAEAEELEDEAEEAEGETTVDMAAYKKMKAEHEAIMKKHEDIGAMVKNLHKALHGEPDGDEKPAGEEKPTEADEAEEKCESEKALRLVGFLLKEANIPEELIEDKAALAKKPIKAIEAEIARQGKIMKLATDSSARLSEGEKKDNASCFGDLQKKF